LHNQKGVRSLKDKTSTSNSFNSQRKPVSRKDAKAQRRDFYWFSLAALRLCAIQITLKNQKISSAKNQKGVMSLKDKTSTGNSFNSCGKQVSRKGATARRRDF
jgi:hypothetical protein